KKIAYIALGAMTLFSSCNKEVLDRNQLTQLEDENSWGNELGLRLYANGFYQNYFVGYNSAWGTDYAPVIGYTFSDDLTNRNVQTNFENSLPASRVGSGSTIAAMEAPSMLTQSSGPTWNFAWVRKPNIF